jgi:hypothetical protein
MPASPFNRIIDGRPVGDIPIAELDPLSIKLHAEAESAIERPEAS